MSSRSHCGSLIRVGLAAALVMGLVAVESASAASTVATVKVGEAVEVRARLENEKLTYTDAKGRTIVPSGVQLEYSSNPQGIKVTGRSGKTRVSLAEGDITVNVPQGAVAIVKEEREDGLAKVTIHTGKGSAVNGVFSWVSRGRTLGMAYELGSTVVATQIPRGGWRVETVEGKTVLIGGDGTRIVVESSPLDGANDVVTITDGDLGGTVKVTVVAGSVIKIGPEGDETTLQVGESFTVETAEVTGMTTIQTTQQEAAPEAGGQGTFGGDD